MVVVERRKKFALQEYQTSGFLIETMPILSRLIRNKSFNQPLLSVHTVPTSCREKNVS